MYQLKNHKLRQLVIALNLSDRGLEFLAAKGGVELQMDRTGIKTISIEQEFYLLHLVKEYILEIKEIENWIQAQEEATGIYRDEKFEIDWLLEERILHSILDASMSEQSRHILGDYYASIATNWRSSDRSILEKMQKIATPQTLHEHLF